MGLNGPYVGIVAKAGGVLGLALWLAWGPTLAHQLFVHRLGYASASDGDLSDLETGY